MLIDARKAFNTPRQSELYYWADYVEMLCLTDPDGAFSAERLGQVAKFADDLGAIGPDALDADSNDVEALLLDIAPGDVDDGDVAVGEEPSPSDNEESFTYESYGRDAEVTDDRLRWCLDIFRFLDSRKKTLGSAYPFNVDSSAMHISKKVPAEEHRTYLFLLACSLLPYVSRQDAQRLTSAFEVLSAEILRFLLPTNAEVDVYGTARSSEESRFQGGAYDRLSALANELRGEVRAKKGDFHPRDAGDNGLDVVGWVPMRDPGAGVLCLFAQCACGRGWDGKQYQASHLRWRRFIELASPSVDTTFIPHYFRKPGGHWYVESDVQGLLIDRLRVLQLLEDRAAPPIPVDLVDELLASARSVA